VSDRSPAWLRELARFCVELSDRTLPAVAREGARQVFFDSLPPIARGMREPEMLKLVDAQLAESGSAQASVLGTGRRASALDAALLNGTAGTWLELNEGSLHARGHPSMQVVPAAFAMAEARGASGGDLLAAVAAGYEACARIGRAANVRLSIHPHGTWGVIGGAVAAAKLKGFDVDRMVETINVASTLGMATARKTLLEGATVRNLFTGHSGHMGLMAVRLVECGFTGLDDGPTAIYTSVLSETFDPAKVTGDLGETWLVTRGYYKLHPTGRYVHAAIDALEDARRQAPDGRIDPDAIERIDVRAYKLAGMLSGQDVTSSFGARFSIPFTLATLLVHGHSGLAAFDDAAVANPRVQALARKVFVVEDPEHTAAYPATQRADLVMRLADGRELRGHCEVMKGEPEHPHSRAELQAKFFELGHLVWSPATTAALWDACTHLEDVPDWGAFTRPLAL
jgi:2-methylcitrate dehydratase PrpD